MLNPTMCGTHHGEKRRKTLVHGGKFIRRNRLRRKKVASACLLFLLVAANRPTGGQRRNKMMMYECGITSNSMRVDGGRKWLKSYGENNGGTGRRGEGEEESAYE